MTGKQAFELLVGMSEEEREGVCIAWIDESTADYLPNDFSGKKLEWFRKQTPKRKGELLGRGLYKLDGDINSTYNKFLDDVEVEVEKAIDESMASEA